MNQCKKDCILNLETLELMGALGLGAAALVAFGACIFADGVITAGSDGGVFAIVCVVGETVSPIAMIVIIGTFILGAIAGLLIRLVYCRLLCRGKSIAVEEAGDIEEELQEEIIPDEGNITCEQAQAMLTGAQERLAQAIAARDEQQVVVNVWKGRIQAARIAVDAAVVAVAATAWWNVIAMAIALATLAAALGTFAALKLAAAPAIATLAALEAGVAAARAVLETWEALVAQLCQISSSTPFDTDDPGSAFTPG